jgi:hypothetical protein
LDYEAFHEDKLTISMRLGVASSKRQRVLQKQKMDNICDVDRYNDIVDGLATHAFPEYLNSRMYKNWRAYEKGAVSSLRARIISVMTMSVLPTRMSLRLTNKPSSTELKSNQFRGTSEADKVDEYDKSRKAFNNTKDQLNRVNSSSLNLLVDEHNKTVDEGKMKGNLVDKRVPYQHHSDSKVVVVVGRAESDGTGSRLIVSSSEVPNTDRRTVDEHVADNSSRLASPRATGAAISVSSVQALLKKEGSGPQGPLPTPALLTRTGSFAEKAFTSASIEEKDTVLLMGSTWVAMLIAGIESVPMAFCLLSADAKHFSSEKTIMPFVYVNSKFEMDYGYVRENLIGRSYKYLFEKANKTASRSSKIDMKKIRDATDPDNDTNYIPAENSGVDYDDVVDGVVDGGDGADSVNDSSSGELFSEVQEATHRRALDESLVEARGKVIDVFIYRGNGKKVKTIICTKPIFDQRNTFRYMMCLSVCMNENVSLAPPSNPSTARKTSPRRGSNNATAHSGSSSHTESTRQQKKKKRHGEREMARKVDFATLVDLMDSLPNKFEDMNLH